jgi:hypothetical protein
MKRRLRQRPGPASIIACIALGVALGGTSYAAADRLLPKNSVGTKQVINGSLQTMDLSAKAKRALKGATGAQGLQGIQGPKGDPGQNGQDLTYTTKLQPGQTETGVYAVGSPSAGNYDSGSIDFHPALAASISNVRYIDPGAPGTTNCPQRGHAARGYLCLYSGANSHTTFCCAYRPSTVGSVGADPDGAALYFEATQGGAYNRGTWAVTAP